MWYMWYMCYMWYVRYMWYMECTWYIVIWKKWWIRLKIINFSRPGTKSLQPNFRRKSAKSLPRSWHHGTMAPWHHGTMAPWHHGTMAPWHHGTMAPSWWFYGKRSRVSHHVTICDNMLPCDFWGSGDKWWRYVTAHWFKWSWFRMKHASSGAFAHRPRLFPPYHDLQTEGCVAPACVWTCRCSECRQFSPGTGMVEVSDS